MPSSSSTTSPKTKRIVLRIGGSVLGSPPHAGLLKEYASVISEARRSGHSVGVVVGGGPTARAYIDAAKALGLPHKEQDQIAIQASRLNAKLVGMRLGVPTVYTTIQGMVAALERGGLAVMGGLRPGITTDTVGAILGKAWRSDLLVKASDQDGIFTADPRTDVDAKLILDLSYRELVKILGVEGHRPGIHSIVDPIAVRYITKNRLKLVVTKGFDPSNVLRAIRGERVGTLVS
jgi:uridylate kinase